MKKKNLIERHVQAIWYDASLRPDTLVTKDGNLVSVVSPGDWNLGHGPDFRNAVLEIGAEHKRLMGDVEVHLCPSDWDLHGHGNDPGYRNVIAHVTWNSGKDPLTLPPGAVTIWLGRLMAQRTDFDPAQIDLAAYPYAHAEQRSRPCEKRLGHNPTIARRVLSRAGRNRLQLKARRLGGLLAEGRCNRRQLYYEEVMAALGYAGNAEAFRRVAQRIPVEELANGSEHLQKAWQCAASFETWQRGLSRPWNDPCRRLQLAARWLIDSPVMELADAGDFDERSCRTMLAELCRGHQIGRGRAAALLANVVVPWAIAEERLSVAPGWLPPEDICAPVRMTAWRLFGRDHNPAAFYANNGLCIQGLLHVWRENCLRHLPQCDDCALATAAEF